LRSGWERIRHVPVEDHDHRLVGLVSYRSVLRFLTKGGVPADAAVSDIMKSKVITVTPRTPTLEAIQIMRQHRIGCLPVLEAGRLIGVVTEENFLKISGDLLEQKLRG
jgi:CBS domain-containing protein